MTTFKEQMNTDLDLFLNSDEFGTDATWKKVTSAGPPVVTTDVSLVGILDTPFTRQSLQKGVENERITYRCKSSLVVGIEQENEIEIDGTTYSVIGIQPDGTGLTVLVLSIEDAA